MRWFKHFTDSLDDPFIQELLDEFGHKGYVAWFGLIEIIAKENGSKLTGKLEVKPAYMKRKLRISSAKMKEIYEFCARKPTENLQKSVGKVKLLFSFEKEKWFFEIPKMLELKDNYTKDLQGAGKKLSNHKEVEKEVEVEVEVEKDKKPSLFKKSGGKETLEKAFDECWKIYPKRNGVRQGKKQASVQFKKLSLTEMKQCYRGIANYSNFCNQSGQSPRDFERFLTHRIFDDYQEKIIVPVSKGQSASDHNAEFFRNRNKETKCLS